LLRTGLHNASIFRLQAQAILDDEVVHLVGIFFQIAARRRSSDGNLWTNRSHVIWTRLFATT
jgi:hypothetical protein